MAFNWIRDKNKGPGGYFKPAENQPKLSAKTRDLLIDIFGIGLTFYAVALGWIVLVLLSCGKK